YGLYLRHLSLRASISITIRIPRSSYSTNRTLRVEVCMNASIHDYTRLGIVHFMAYPQCASGDGDILTSIRTLAHDPYFNVLEITRINDAAARKEIRAIAAATTTDLAFGAQPII